MRRKLLFTKPMSPIYTHTLVTHLRHQAHSTLIIPDHLSLSEKKVEGECQGCDLQERRGSAGGEPWSADSVQGSSRRKVLVHTPSNEVITSYEELESKLASVGWERYYEDPNLLQFHKRSTIDLISLPKDFSRFKSMHMYDIVVKNRDSFQVRDM